MMNSLAPFVGEDPKNGAGGGNRTHITSLEGSDFTTKLHPQKASCH